MLARRLIPCLDVSGGRVVKGVRFQELRDAGDPVEGVPSLRFDARIAPAASMANCAEGVLISHRPPSVEATATTEPDL